MGADESRAAAGGAARSLTVDAQTRAALEAVYADYAAALDEARYDDWLELFDDACAYVVQPRENFERGLPLATMALESKAMLVDRVYGVSHTLFHAPYYQRHVIGPLRVLALDGGDDGCVRARVEASYAVYRTKVHQPSEVFNVGRYVDRLVCRDGVWRFEDKRAIFDTELIANSLIYPI